MPFLPNLGRKGLTGAQIEQSSNPRAYGVPSYQVGKPYRESWDVARAMKDGMERVTWVFRCIDAIAMSQSRLPLGTRVGDREKGKFQTDPGLDVLFNVMANPYESAFTWRYRLSAQLLLSKKGVFVEVIRDNAGRPIGLYLLPPDRTDPIPDPNKFISGFRVNMPGDMGGVANYVDVKPENVIWIRKPHPLDPYRGITPLEAAGLAIDLDWLAKLYNRRFIGNDSRPGVVLGIKGDVDEDTAQELKMRMAGPPDQGYNGAGRVIVLEADDIAMADTSVSPRDAQYLEARKYSKEEIYQAFGVPETVAGNASGRTFDNADAEYEGYWRDTMLGHLEVIERPLDVLSPPDRFTDFDTSSVEVLSRDKRDRAKFMIQERLAGLLTGNMYLEATGRERVDDPSMDEFYMMTTYAPVASELGLGFGLDGASPNANADPNAQKKSLG